MVGCGRSMRNQVRKRLSIAALALALAFAAAGCGRQPAVVEKSTAEKAAEAAAALDMGVAAYNAGDYAAAAIWQPG